MAYSSNECPYGDCFALAKHQSKYAPRPNACTCLKEIPQDRCAFQKPFRNVTNGVYYPDDSSKTTVGTDFVEPKRSIVAWAEDWDKTLGHKK